MENQTKIMIVLIILLLVAGGYILYSKTVPGIKDKYRIEGYNVALNQLGNTAAQCQQIPLNFIDPDNNIRNITLFAVECVQR